MCYMIKIEYQWYSLIKEITEEGTDEVHIVGVYPLLTTAYLFIWNFVIKHWKRNWLIAQKHYVAFFYLYELNYYFGIIEHLNSFFIWLYFEEMNCSNLLVYQ